MVPDWKTKGKRRTLADSFGDAARGFLYAVKTERNMRIHVTAAVYVLFFSRFLGVTRGEYAALLLAVAMVITAEGFNTAIEMLCDFAQKSYNRFIGRTKDIAAGAVLVSAVFAAFVGVTVLWRPAELWTLAQTVFTSPVWCPLFVLTAALALVFIFAGPEGIAGWFERKKKK
ncbi:MAG: diacylglycerol kinase family protein [Hominenteromicrobium sp.]